MIASCANVFNVRIFFQIRACVVMSEWRRCLTITTVHNLCMLRPSMLRKAVCGYSRTGSLLSCNERVVCTNCVSCYKKKYNYSVTPLGPQQRSPYPPWTMSGRRWTRLKTRIRVTQMDHILLWLCSVVSWGICKDNMASWRGLPYYWTCQRKTLRSIWLHLNRTL